jgi:uncharacterized protein
MRTSDTDILVIPGWTGSGPDHWQSRWEGKLSTARRVEQEDWQRPVFGPWVEGIRQAVAASTKPVVLVAHSLGVHAAVHAAPGFASGKVAGAFLVTPPSDTAVMAAREIMDPAFVAPAPRLAFPSVLIASRNDSFSSYEWSEAFAARLGAELIDAGEQGHINGASGHGPWPEGLMSFAGFLRKLG